MNFATQQRFVPHGLLALDPKAFGGLFEVSSPEPCRLTESGVAVVTVRGPLMHHRDFFFDSYEAIRDRVAEALALNPKFLLLSIDSPGGVVSGLFDAARDLRKMAEAANVDLYAHVEGHATSAAYALASAASWIGVSESAIMGSIGVIATLIDATAQNAAQGLSVQIVASGSRKSDGNPNVQISQDALDSEQGRVDRLAGMFFDLVSDHGWLDPQSLADMQAEIVTGDQAVRLGLATEIATLEQAIAFAVPAHMRQGAGAQSTKGKYTMMANPIEDAVKLLRDAAEGEDEEQARKARKALEALEEDKEAREEEEDASTAEEEDTSRAEDDDDTEQMDPSSSKAEDRDDEEHEQQGKSAADGSESAMVVAAKALAEVHRIKAERVKEKRSKERAALLASRPDFSPEFVKVLRGSPMATVREFCKTLPKGPARADRVAAAATATGTRGEGQGDGFAARLPAAEKAALDAKMGLAEISTKTVETPTRLSFGVRVPMKKKGNE